MGSSAMESVENRFLAKHACMAPWQSNVLMLIYNIEGMRLEREIMLRSIEICAGAGGQALGLEQAGFSHVALVEIEPAACDTLRINRPSWNVIEEDVHSFSARQFEGTIDLLAGGVPCPPFSVAGK